MEQTSALVILTIYFHHSRSIHSPNRPLTAVSIEMQLEERVGYIAQQQNGKLYSSNITTTTMALSTIRQSNRSLSFPPH